jgi:outer membrane phospholipase A
MFAALGTRAEFFLQAPRNPVTAGDEFSVVLLETNPGESPRTTAAPTHLPLVAYAGGNRVASAVFHTVGNEAPPATIPAGGFHRVTLRGSLPASFTGLVVLETSAFDAGRIAVELRAAAPADQTAGAANTTLDELSSSTGQHAAPITLPPRRDLGIAPHEPIYFSVGARDGFNARFQLSFKFRPIGPSDDRVGGRGFWEDFYTSFTQTSLWDLHSLSKPFTDSSYRPAVFYQRHDTGFDLLGGRLGFTGGFEHESNGKGGADSRSINIAFARPVLRWGRPDTWQFTAAPKLYWYLEKSENDDIQRFRGYGDFLFALEHPRSWKLAATLRAGTGGHGSVQLDASYPFSRINSLFPLGLVHGYLHLQLFDGWGESLLHYDERAETQLRVGFMALR